MKPWIPCCRIFCLWTVAVPAFFFFSSACQKTEPLKIGFLGGTSGRVADLGISGLDAVQLVAKDDCKEADAALVVLTARMNQKKNQDLKQTLAAIRSFKGLQSDMIFDEFGDMVRKNASISVVRNRKFVVIEQ